MDLLMSCFFDGVFCDLERGSLYASLRDSLDEDNSESLSSTNILNMSVFRILLELLSTFIRWFFFGSEADCLITPRHRYLRSERRLRRRALCEYLSTMIRSCSAIEGDTETTCDKAVQGAIQFHKRTKNKNGGICLMGKYHNVLYVAARLAFMFNLRNTITVEELLRQIFDCEGTFERIVSGAIFGPRICGAFSGWKSEFDSRDECIEALKYFLHHAMLARASFIQDGLSLRMADVPLITCMNASPVTVALQIQRPEVFSLFVEYGAKIHNMPFDLMSPMDLLSEMRKTPQEKRTLQSMQCLCIAQKIHPPAEGWPLPSLKHLAKIAIRESLNDNFQLPIGIEELPLPKILIKYISLEGD